MTPTLWAWCDCTTEPVAAATRTDPARLDLIRETLETQIRAGFGHNCGIRLTVTEDNESRPEPCH